MFQRFIVMLDWCAVCLIFAAAAFIPNIIWLGFLAHFENLLMQFKNVCLPLTSSFFFQPLFQEFLNLHQFFIKWIIWISSKSWFSFFFRLTSKPGSFEFSFFAFQSSTRILTWKNIAYSFNWQRLLFKLVYRESRLGSACWGIWRTPTSQTRSNSFSHSEVKHFLFSILLDLIQIWTSILLNIFS